MNRISSSSVPPYFQNPASKSEPVGQAKQLKMASSPAQNFSPALASRRSQTAGFRFFKQLRAVVRAITSPVNSVLNIGASLAKTVFKGAKAVSKTIWTIVTYPYRKIKGLVFKIKNSARRLAEHVAWLKVRQGVGNALSISRQIPQKDRARLAGQIVRAMRAELTSRHKSLLTLSKTEQTALAKAKAEEVLNPYLQQTVYDRVVDGLPPTFNAAQKTAIADEVQARLRVLLADQGLSWLQLAQTNRLNSLVQTTTQAVVQDVMAEQMRRA